jgi:hypothetical protein
MKDGQFQFDITKMTCTFCQHLTTRLTGGPLAAYTQPGIKHPIFLRSPFRHLHMMYININLHAISFRFGPKPSSSCTITQRKNQQQQQ